MLKKTLQGQNTRKDTKLRKTKTESFVAFPQRLPALSPKVDDSVYPSLQIVITLV